MKYTQPGKKCGREFHNLDEPMLIIMVYVLTRLKHYFISIHIALKRKKNQVERSEPPLIAGGNRTSTHFGIRVTQNPKPTWPAAPLLHVSRRANQSVNAWEPFTQMSIAATDLSWVCTVLGFVHESISMSRVSTADPLTEPRSSQWQMEDPTGKASAGMVVPRGGVCGVRGGKR